MHNSPELTSVVGMNMIHSLFLFGPALGLFFSFAVDEGLLK